MKKLTLRVRAVTLFALVGAVAIACGNKDDSGGGDGDGDGDGDVNTGTGGAVLATGGGTGTGGLAGTGGGTSSACTESGTTAGTDPLIDDLDHLESGSLPVIDGRMGSWFVSNDGTVGGTQEPTSATAYPTEGAGQDGASDHAFASSASGFTEWGANFGITLNAVGMYGCAHDASAYTGISFWAKTGDGSTQTINLALPMLEVIPVARGGSCAGMGCDDAHKKAVEIDGEWAEYTVLWSEVTQDSGWTHDNKYDFDPATLAQITWAVGAAVGEYDVVVDDVMFVGGNGAGGAGGAQ